MVVSPCFSIEAMGIPSKKVLTNVSFIPSDCYKTLSGLSKRFWNYVDS